jgi:pilus assembly protein CpaE
VATVAVFGSNDRTIADLLTAAGMSVRVADDASLQTYARSGPAPDVLVIDTRGADGVPPVLALVKRRHPDLGIVIVAATMDPALMLDAMRAGVSELIVEPLSQAELDRAIARVLNQRPVTEVGKVIGFVGAKGGVGTTTVAVNVAAALAAADRTSRVLLIDMHQAGGDASVFAGVEPKFSIVDAIDNTHRLDHMYFSGLVTEVRNNFDLLASSERPFVSPGDPSKIRAVLDFVSTSYKYVVLDLPRSDSAVLDALDVASTLFIVANQELATVKSGARLASALRQRYGRDRVRMVLSRSDRQADIGVSDVERVVGAPISHTFPSDYRVALQALNKGRPLVLDGDSDLAASFEKFTDTLAGRKREKAQPSKGLLGRLTQR